MGDAIPGQVDLSYVRKEAEQAKGSKSVSNIFSKDCAPFLPPESHLEFLSWIPSVLDSGLEGIRWSKFFPHQVYFDQSLITELET